MTTDKSVPDRIYIHSLTYRITDHTVDVVQQQRKNSPSYGKQNYQLTKPTDLTTSIIQQKQAFNIRGIYFHS